MALRQNSAFEVPISSDYDVIVIGGGVVGCSAAWHLLAEAADLRVLVVEPDPSFTQAASSASSGGVRQLFTRPENVLMSQYTLELIDGWSSWTSPSGDTHPDAVIDLGWRDNGYLFITSPDLSDALHDDYEQQLLLGVEASWLEPDGLRELYPEMETADLGTAVLSTRDGWLDPNSFAVGLRQRAKSSGAEFVTNRAVSFETSGHRVVGVVLESGHTVRAAHVVNAAGVWGVGLSKQLGLDLPVEPMRRFDHFVHTPGEFSSRPFIKDPGGLAVRPEGDGLNAAIVDFSTPGGWDLSIDRSWFDEVVWPALCERIPSTENLRLVSTWAGFYDQNRFDGNMILDRWADQYENYFFATGFSGHGLMHAPAVGRALAELIVHGSFQSLDLSRMGLQRIKDDQPYRETTVR